MINESQRQMMDSYQYLIDAIRDIECGAATAKTWYSVTSHVNFNLVDDIRGIESSVPGMLLEVYEDYINWLECQLEGGKDEDQPDQSEAE